VVVGIFRQHGLQSGEKRLVLCDQLPREARAHHRLQQLAYRALQAPQLAHGLQGRRHLAQQPIPVEAHALQALDRRQQQLRMPGERVLELRQELGADTLRFLAELVGARGAERRHLPLPAREQVAAHKPDAYPGAQRLEVLGARRLGLADSRRPLQRLPLRVEHELHRAEPAASREVLDDEVDDSEPALVAVVLVDARPVLEDQVRALRRELPRPVHEIDQRAPRHGIGAARDAGVDRVQAPFLRGGDELERLVDLAEETSELARVERALDVAPQVLAQLARVGAVTGDALHGVGELHRREQGGGLGDGKVQLALLARGEHAVRSVEFAELARRERRLRGAADRRGDPVMNPAACGDPACGLRGLELLAPDLDVAVLGADRRAQPLAQLAQLRDERGPLLLAVVRDARQLARIVAGQALGDLRDRDLELLPPARVAVEHRDAKRLDVRVRLVAQHAQRLRRMAGDEDALSLGEQVADEVADGVGLARSRGALDDHRARAVQALGEVQLLDVRFLGEQDVGVLVGRSRCGFALRGRGLRRLRVPVQAGDAHERGREGLGGLDVLEDALDGAAHADRAQAREYDRVARYPRRVALPAQLLLRGDELAAAKRPQHALEVRGRLGVERMVEMALDLLDAVLEHAAVDLAAGAEERRVQLGHVVGLGEGELGRLGIEDELDALEQYRVVDRALFDAPVEDAVADEQLDLLRLALDLPVQRVQPLEQRERGALGPLGLLPGGALGLPSLERPDPRALVVEAARLAAFLDRVAHPRFGAELVPAGREPRLELGGRPGTGCRRGTTDPEDESLIGLLRIGPRHRGARREVAQPQDPGLLGDLPHHGVAQLDVGVEELENPADPRPGDVGVAGIERYDVGGCRAERAGHGDTFFLRWLPCILRPPSRVFIPRVTGSNARNAWFPWVS
jgi:hypothetical protein